MSIFGKLYKQKVKAVIEPNPRDTDKKIRVVFRYIDKRKELV